MKNVKNRKKKTQKLSDAAPCTHKTISQAFMPMSRSPRHRLWSSILVVPTARQLKPRWLSGWDFVVTLHSIYWSERRNPHPCQWEGETVNSQTDEQLAILIFLVMETVPEQAGLQNCQVEFGHGCSGFGFSCRGMPVGYWHAIIGTFCSLNNFIQTQKARLFTSLPTHSDPSHPASVSRKLGGKKSNIFNFLLKTDHRHGDPKFHSEVSGHKTTQQEQLVCLSTS